MSVRLVEETTEHDEIEVLVEDIAEAMAVIGDKVTRLCSLVEERRPKTEPAFDIELPPEPGFGGDDDE